MIKLNTVLTYWGPVIIYCGFIFWQSHFPVPDKLPSFPFQDKLLHIAGYAVLGALSFRAINAGEPPMTSYRTILLAILYTTLYGISDELHQSMIASRSADAADVVADFIGGTMGTVFYYTFLKRFSNSKFDKNPNF